MLIVKVPHGCPENSLGGHQAVLNLDSELEKSKSHEIGSCGQPDVGIPDAVAPHNKHCDPTDENVTMFGHLEIIPQINNTKYVITKGAESKGCSNSDISGVLIGSHS